MSIESIVEQLELLPHPEGGFYKETYRSSGLIPKNALTNDFDGDRNYATGIYFLLTSNNFSAFHRIKSDEMWHFYSGSPLSVHVIDEKGNYTKHIISNQLEKGHKPQLVVPANCWFASSVDDKNTFALVGCTVSPGFDFNDFELANRDSLMKAYPKHSDIITRLTRI